MEQNELVNKGLEAFKNRRYSEAASYLAKVQNIPDPRVQYAIGYMLFYGKGVNRSYEQAYNFFTHSAKAGNAGAQYYLAKCYKDGIVVEESIDKAVFYYKKACEQNHPLALLELGYLFLNGNGVEQSYKNAAICFDKAARQEVEEAQVELGYLYYQGNGVDQSYEKAFYWFKKAAEKGNVPAMVDVGCCYMNGQGVANSGKEAMYWFKKAAKENNAAAYFYIGFCYYCGIGVARSNKESRYYMDIAASLGHEQAIDAKNRKDGPYEENIIKRNLGMTLVFLILLLVGVGLSLVTIFVDYDPATMANAIWLGMCLISFSLAGITYLAYSPNGHSNTASKVLCPIISIGLLVAVYFVFRIVLFNTYARYEGDIETIHIAIATCVGTGVLLNLIFMFFYAGHRKKKAYIISLLLAIPIAFVAMMIGNMIHILTWAVIIEGIATVVAAIFTWSLIGTITDNLPETKTVLKSSGEELTYTGNGEYRDESGNTWVSGEGNSVYRKDD